MGKIGDIAALGAVCIGGYLIYKWLKGGLPWPGGGELPQFAKELEALSEKWRELEEKYPIKQEYKGFQAGPAPINMYQAFKQSQDWLSRIKWPTWPTTWGVSGKPLGTVGQEPSYPSTGQKYEWITRERF